MTGSQRTPLQSITRLHMIITILICGAGILLILAGLVILYLGKTGSIELSFFGPKLKSTNVGLAVVLIGASCLVLVAQDIAKTFREISGGKTPSQHERSVEKAANPNLTSTPIMMHLSQDLRNLHMTFGVLHVRDGKDEISDSGPLLNEEVPFKDVGRQGTMVATVEYAKNLGFQFKCFVDFKNIYILYR